MNGIGPEIVARANELSALSMRGEDLVAICSKLCPDEMDDLEEAVKALPLESMPAPRKLIVDAGNDREEVYRGRLLQKAVAHGSQRGLCDCEIPLE